MKLKISILLCNCMMLILGFSTCSSDDDKEDITNTFPQAKDSVVVDFLLLNEHGDTTTVFNEGEDIIFDLSITNYMSTSLTYVLPQLFGDNTFRVYTLNDEDCGLPWLSDRDWEDILRTLLSGRKLHYQCSWYGHSESQYHFPAPKNNNTQHLEAGEYYTSVYINFDNYKVLHHTINFRINDNE